MQSIIANLPKRQLLFGVIVLGLVAAVAGVVYMGQVSRDNELRGTKSRASVNQLIVAGNVCRAVITIPTNTPTPTLTPTITPTPTSTPTPTPTVFVCDKKLDVAIVLDRSSTMTDIEADGRAKLAWAKEAIIDLLSALKASGQASANVRVSIDSFGAQGNDGTGQLKKPDYNSTLDQPLTGDFDAAITSAQGIIYKKPGTCIECGLRIGNDQLTTTANKRAVVLLSDGMANHTWDGTASSSQGIAQAIARANSGRTAGLEYRVIGYGRKVVPTGAEQEIDEDTLIKIAGNAANYVYKPDPAEWANSFATIVGDLCK